MSLEEVFPEDPNTASLSYAAFQRLPIVLPWSREPVDLAVGVLTTDVASSTTFTRPSAFSDSSLANIPIVYAENQGGSFTESTSSSNAKSYEHMDISFSASVGGSVLGASGRGTYETKAMTNQQGVKSSVRTRCCAGTVAYQNVPDLSTAACETLQFGGKDGVDPAKAFLNMYGDYYVAGLRIGAANASLVIAAASASSASKDMAAEITVKFLGFTKTKEIEEHEASASFAGLISLTAFDTLEGCNIDEQGTGQDALGRLKPIADANLGRGQDIEKRARVLLDSLKIRNGTNLSGAECRALSGAGIVVELLLLPYSGLREYVSISLGRH